MNMITGHQKKVAALLALGLVWGGLLAWHFFTQEEPVRVPLVNVSGRAAASGASRPEGDDLRVHLALLASARHQREMDFVTPKNIFALPDDGGPSNDGVVATGESAARQQSVAAELAQFHYLGFVRVGEEWEKKQDLAVLTKHDDLHLVKKGQTVENHVLVKTITQESVTLLDRDSRVEYTVLLSEEPVAQ